MWKTERLRNKPFYCLCLSKVRSLLSLRISRFMLKVEHSFELRNLYNLRFTESDICFFLCLSTKLKPSTKTDSNLFIVTISEFSIFLSTKSRVEH